MTASTDAERDRTRVRTGLAAIGFVVTMIAVWLLSAALFIVPSQDLRLAAGAVGTPGTLAVQTCRHEGKDHYCHGLFTPDTGGDPIPLDAPPDSTAGEQVAAQLSPGGDRVVQTGIAGVLSALALPLLGVAILSLLSVVAIRVGSETTWKRRFATIGGSTILSVAVIGMIAGCVAPHV